LAIALRPGGKRDHDRLRVISEIHDSRTRDLLTRAGLSSGHRFVEFGCGLGFVTRWAATAGRRSSTGIDANEEQIAAARR
jgi:2-polyprenyl-3-methyl-5-hydroxy-6-metoxy-1,4-benzoquinol methylase